MISYVLVEVSLILYRFDLFVIRCKGCKLLHSFSGLYIYNRLFYFLFPLLCDRFEADSEKHSTPVIFHFLKLFCQSRLTVVGLLVLFSHIFPFGVKNDFSNSSVLGFLHPMKLHVCIYIGDFILHNIMRLSSISTTVCRNSLFKK
jgi:hypothetical protein